MVFLETALKTCCLNTSEIKPLAVPPGPTAMWSEEPSVAGMLGGLALDYRKSSTTVEQKSMFFLFVCLKT